MIIHVKMHSKAWHKERARGIGASESPALFDCQAGYALSQYSLAAVKKGLIEFPMVDSDLARNGLLLEPTIARIHAERQGWKIRHGYYAKDDHEPRMRCSLDYLIAEPNDIDRKMLGRKVSGEGVLQIKSVIAPQWARMWSEETIPRYVEIQVQQELACTGLEWGCVGALVGGMTPRLYWLHRDKVLHDNLRRRIDQFWLKYVEGKEMPPIDASESSRLALRELRPAREFLPGMHNYEQDDRLNDMATDYDSACANLTQAQADKAGAENRLLERLGSVKLAYTADWWIEYSVTTNRRALKVSRRRTAVEE